VRYGVNICSIPTNSFKIWDVIIKRWDLGCSKWISNLTKYLNSQMNKKMYL
jgi:hypothetical protein